MSIQQITLPNTQTWSNWVGNQSFTPAEIRTAATESEVSQIVADAAAQGLGVRTYGAGHSFSPIIETEGVLLDLSPMSGILNIDPANRQVTALPKTTIAEFGDPLWAQGLSLANQGDIDTQAIAGAISTATHGSGKRLTNFSATLASARFVDGLGNVVEVTPDKNADVLPALQTSIGLLGIMTELTINVGPSYLLHFEHKIMSFDETMEHFDDYMERYRHFSFFWMPSEASAALYMMENTKADDCVVRLGQEATPEMLERTLLPSMTVGRPHEIYPIIYDPNFHEMEYFMPLECAKEVIREMRQLMLRWRPHSTIPLEMRIVAADHAWMSPNYDRTAVVLSIAGQPGTDYWPYLRACDSLFAEFKGRPHWGKLNFMTADRLARLFPRYDDFMQMRRRFDPKGTFLNNSLRPLFE